MWKRAMTTLPLTLALVAAACGIATTSSSPPLSTGAPTPSASATPGAVATPTPPATTATTTASPTAPAAPPDPTPVVLTVSGHVTLAPDGRPVPGVRLRIAPFAISGGCSTPCPRAPGPDVVVTSDATGAYSAKVPAWTLEALADSSSSQLSLFVTPPAGMKVLAVTRSSTLPIGPIAPNVPEWYFMLARDLNGPIDITLAAQ